MKQTYISLRMVLYTEKLKIKKQYKRGLLKMKMNEFINEIQGTYYKYFKDSKIQVDFTSNLYNSIYIKCLLARDKTEVAHGIIDNDMLHIKFSIDHNGKAFDKDITINSIVDFNDLNLNCWDKSYLIKPNDRFLAYSSRKLTFRKTKGDTKKVISTLDKFFKKLKDQLISDYNENMIHKSHIEIVKKKLGL